MTYFNRIIFIWTPISEKVGTVEVELGLINSLLNSKALIYHIGASKYFSNSFPSHNNLVQMLPNRLLNIYFKFKHIFAGRIVVLLQSFSAIFVVIYVLLKYRPRNIVFLTCLFPLPVLVLNFVITRIIKAIKSQCFCFIQGAPVFNMNQINRSLFNWRSLESIMRNLLFRYLYVTSDGIVVSSKTLENKLLNQKFFSNKPIYLIPNGVLPLLTVPKPIYDFRDPNPVNFLFVGRLTHQKNINGLINSFISNASKLSYQSALHVVGSGDLHSTLISRFSKYKNVHFYGYLSDPWNLNFINTVVIVPSFWEEPGHVPLEAIYHMYITLFSNKCTCIDFVPSNFANIFTFDPHHLDNLFLRISSYKSLTSLLPNLQPISASVKCFSQQSFQESIMNLVQKGHFV